MRHKLCRSFHPWCPGVKNRCLLPTVICFARNCQTPQIAKFMGPTWGPPGSCRPQMGPMLAPWTLLSGSTQFWGIVWGFTKMKGFPPGIPTSRKSAKYIATYPKSIEGLASPNLSQSQCTTAARWSLFNSLILIQSGELGNPWNCQWQVHLSSHLEQIKLTQTKPVSWL